MGFLVQSESTTTSDTSHGSGHGEPEIPFCPGPHDYHDTLGRTLCGPNKIITLSFAIMISLLFMMEYLLHKLEKATNSTSYQVLVQKVFKEMTALGCVTFLSFLITIHSDESIFPDIWINSLHHADLVVFVMAMWGVLQASLLMFFARIQSKVWKLTANLTVENLLSEFYEDDHGSIMRWLPNSFRDKLELKIFEFIFCYKYTIRKTDFNFAGYLSESYERYLVAQLEENLHSRMFFGLLLFFNYIRLLVVPDAIYISDYEQSRCEAEDDLVLCLAKQRMNLFMFFGWLLVLIAFILLYLSRLYEIRLLSKAGVTSIYQYRGFLVREEVKEIKKAKATLSGRRRNSISLSKRDIKNALQSVKENQKEIDVIDFSKRDSYNNPGSSSFSASSMFFGGRVLSSFTRNRTVSSDAGVLSDENAASRGGGIGGGSLGAILSLANSFSRSSFTGSNRSRLRSRSGSEEELTNNQSSNLPPSKDSKTVTFAPSVSSTTTTTTTMKKTNKNKKPRGMSILKQMSSKLMMNSSHHTKTPPSSKKNTDFVTLLKMRREAKINPSTSIPSSPPQKQQQQRLSPSSSSSSSPSRGFVPSPLRSSLSFFGKTQNSSSLLLSSSTTTKNASKYLTNSSTTLENVGDQKESESELDEKENQSESREMIGRDRGSSIEAPNIDPNVLSALHRIPVQCSFDIPSSNNGTSTTTQSFGLLGPPRHSNLQTRDRGSSIETPNTDLAHLAAVQQTLNSALDMNRSFSSPSIASDASNGPSPQLSPSQSPTHAQRVRPIPVPTSIPSSSSSYSKQSISKTNIQPLNNNNNNNNNISDHSHFQSQPQSEISFNLEEMDDFTTIFLSNRSYLFFDAIKYLLELNCLYFSLWITNFIVLPGFTENARVSYHFQIVLPLIVILPLLAMLVRNASLIKAITEIDGDAIGKIIELDEETEKVAQLLREKIKNKLSKFCSSESHEEHKTVIATLVKEVASDAANQRTWKNFLLSIFKIFFCSSTILCQRNSSDGSIEETNELNEPIITSKGFNKMLRRLQLYFSDKKYQMIWDSIDKDMSGSISAEELYEFVYPSDARLDELVQRSQITQSNISDIKTKKKYSISSLGEKRNSKGFLFFTSSSSSSSYPSSSSSSTIPNSTESLESNQSSLSVSATLSSSASASASSSSSEIENNNNQPRNMTRKFSDILLSGFNFGSSSSSTSTTTSSSEHPPPHHHHDQQQEQQQQEEKIVKAELELEEEEEEEEKEEEEEEKEEEEEEKEEEEEEIIEEEVTEVTEIGVEEKESGIKFEANLPSDLTSPLSSLPFSPSSSSSLSSSLSSTLSSIPTSSSNITPLHLNLIEEIEEELNDYSFEKKEKEKEKEKTKEGKMKIENQLQENDMIIKKKQNEPKQQQKQQQQQQQQHVNQIDVVDYHLEETEIHCEEEGGEGEEEKGKCSSTSSPRSHLFGSLDSIALSPQLHSKKYLNFPNIFSSTSSPSSSSSSSSSSSLATSSNSICSLEIDPIQVFSAPLDSPSPSTHS